MELSIAKLLIDFGLVVLIWMVQMVAYPSFKFMDEQSLRRWHSRYARGISMLVIPLMLGQLALSVALLYKNFSLYQSIDFLLVLSVWAITFVIFVPAHQAISKGNGNATILRRLVVKNWFRTAIWTAIFLYNLGMSSNLY